jgi:hypothetical protein
MIWRCQPRPRLAFGAQAPLVADAQLALASVIRTSAAALFARCLFGCCELKHAYEKGQSGGGGGQKLWLARSLLGLRKFCEKFLGPN